jgi:DNA (cytosine-5)-methyltransferase 1
MTRPRLLDLCCGAGGASMGYARAGFDVEGVDIRPQPHYPFPFHVGDALDWPLAGYDAVHASPPCQAYSVARQRGKRYPALIEPIRARLEGLGVPWIIENVPGAPLVEPVTVCGFTRHCIARDLDGTWLALKRHRLFESNVALFVAPCACAKAKADGDVLAGVYGGGGERRDHAQRDGRRGGYTPTAEVRRALMGIAWMNRDELGEAIPPSYTDYLGRQLRAAL